MEELQKAVIAAHVLDIDQANFPSGTGLVDNGNPPKIIDASADLDAVAMAGSVLVTQCHGAAAAAGWWGDFIESFAIHVDVAEVRHGTRMGKAMVAQKLMLIVSEVAEAMEGHRKGLKDDKLPHRDMLEVELADAVIRIADLAGAMGLDLGGAIAEKMAFNAVRPDHKPEARAAAGGKSY